MKMNEYQLLAQRMCEASGDTCLSCPVDGGGTCAFIQSPWSLTEEKIAETEKKVMDWAAAFVPNVIGDYDRQRGECR